jgi:hypothetical protein
MSSKARRSTRKKRFVPRLETVMEEGNNANGNNANVNNNANRNMPVQTLAGHGSFGAVITPALYNEINGVKRNFPGNVTKLIYKRSAYNKTLRNADLIHTHLPRLAYPIEPYRRRVHLGNIHAPDVHNIIQSRLEDQGLPSTNNVILYPVRMKNMGVDLHKIYRDPELQKELLTNVPLIDIVRQMKRAVQMVRYIFNSGYIHGDIREFNVLCNLTDGKLQVIDFDFMMPIRDFKDSMLTKYYSNPFEVYFLKPDESNNEDSGIVNLIDLVGLLFENENDADIHKELNKMLDINIREHYKIMVSLLIQNLPDKADSIVTKLVRMYVKQCRSGIIDLVRALKSQGYSNIDGIEHFKIEIRRSAMETKDIYGLGIAFLFYLQGLRSNNRYSAINNKFPSGSKSDEKNRIVYYETTDKLERIILQMISPSPVFRLWPGDVIVELDKIIKSLASSPPAHEGGYRTLTRRAHKTKRHTTIKRNK